MFMYVVVKFYPDHWSLRMFGTFLMSLLIQVYIQLIRSLILSISLLI
uniref:Uncharacterized protein n=1 Tax=Arundo donax TaxID=35708 RepID=A0A0A8ZR01_ARUDO